MRRWPILSLVCLPWLVPSQASAQRLDERAANAIQIYEANPRYWQMNGQPVLLAGGFVDDNPFQYPQVAPMLDDLVAVGGNYMRNTMSDRRDKGHEVYPFGERGPGRYDLDTWNPEFWRRLRTYLEETEKRGIVVQIELWDRFDYSRENWDGHPYNPRNNVNYTVESSGLQTEYPRHPNDDVQPFFHTVPGMDEYEPRYDIVRRYQDAYVDELLSISLQHDNVLYCMNNETSTHPRWGQYWMTFIRQRAGEAGVPVFATDMFDDGYKPHESEHYAAAIADTEMYPFLDISQINSRNFDERHWEVLGWYLRRTADRPRPLNNTKIYGGGYRAHDTGGLDDGVERFWRNLLSGAASARFHRPTSGNGLNDHAQGSLKSLREIEKHVRLWDLEPRQHMPLLTRRGEDEAYVMARPGRAYLVYFTRGGSVSLDLSGDPGDFELRWIFLHDGYQLGEPTTVSGGAIVDLTPRWTAPWVAILKHR